MSLTDEQLSAIRHRCDRFLSRLAGAQTGSTALAAQLSAVDVPDLLAEVDRLTAEVDKLYIALSDLTSATHKVGEAARKAGRAIAEFNGVLEPDEVTS